MKLEQQQLYNSRMDWWNKLDDSWKSIFFYNYLLKRAHDVIGATVWKNKEIAGGDGERGVVGMVNLTQMSNRFPFPVYFVVMETLKSSELFDISPEHFWTYEFEGCNYKIYWNFYPESTNGLRELKQMEAIHLYKQDNDATKQPQIDVKDFRNLDNLKELHLHISHTDHLQDILLLNLPRLQKICFYVGINEHSCHYTFNEEAIIEAMREKTNVELTLSCYVD